MALDSIKTGQDFIKATDKILEDNNLDLSKEEAEAIRQLSKDKLQMLRGEVSDLLSIDGQKISDIISNPEKLGKCLRQSEHRARIALFLIGKWLMTPDEMQRVYSDGYAFMQDRIEAYKVKTLQSEDANLKENKWLTDKYPAFTGLLNKILANPKHTEAELSALKMRMDLYRTLEESKKSMGSIHSHTIKIAIPAAQAWLTAENPDTKAKIETYFIDWDGVENPNHSFSKHSVGVLDFISGVTNRTDIVIGLFWEKSADLKNIDTKLQGRLTRFMMALESSHPELDKQAIKSIYWDIAGGKLKNAQNQIASLCSEKFTRKEWDFSSGNGLGNALRTIKARDAAEWAYLIDNEDTNISSSAKTAPTESWDVSDAEKNIQKYISEKFEARKIELGPKAIKKTNEIYETMKKSADPNYAQQVAVRPDFEEATLNTLTLVSIIQDYVRNHPNAKELPPSLRQYDSMKGVRFWTLSDEGAEMTRDFAILAAGFIATMGTSAILEGVVVGARAIQAGRTIAAAKNLEKASALQKAFGFVNVNTARVIGAVANQGEKVVNISRALDQSGKVLGTSLRIVRDSMTMSVIDTAGKSVFTLEAGDVSEDFGDFFYKTLKNIEMFTLFHGAGSMVGKIKGIPKFKPFLTSKGTIPKITNGVMDITGDVTAMYVLHLVDTGKVSLSPKELLELAEQALLYRGAAAAVGRYMPKLNQKLAEASEKYALAIKTGVSPKEIARNSKIKDPEKRLEKAKEVLGKKTQWSPEQERAIEEAHLVGADRPGSGVYNYTRQEIAQKTRILKKAGFEKSEIRDLMEHGVVGGGDVFLNKTLWDGSVLLLLKYREGGITKQQVMEQWKTLKEEQLKKRDISDSDVPSMVTLIEKNMMSELDLIELGKNTDFQKQPNSPITEVGKARPVSELDAQIIDAIKSIQSPKVITAKELIGQSSTSTSEQITNPAIQHALEHGLNINIDWVTIVLPPKEGEGLRFWQIGLKWEQPTVYTLNDTISWISNNQQAIEILIRRNSGTILEGDATVLKTLNKPDTKGNSAPKQETAAKKTNIEASGQEQTTTVTINGKEETFIRPKDHFKREFSIEDNIKLPDSIGNVIEAFGFEVKGARILLPKEWHGSFGKGNTDFIYFENTTGFRIKEQSSSLLVIEELTLWGYVTELRFYKNANGTINKIESFNSQNAGRTDMYSLPVPEIANNKASIEPNGSHSSSESSRNPPKREKAPKQEYIGNADQFIISKLNKSDEGRFQQEGFDLTSIGFEGWTVKQTQKKGISSFQLKHVSGKEHTNISTPKEVQEILRPSDAPVIMAPVSAVEALVPRIASKPIEALLNRQAFLWAPRGENARVSLAELGIPEWVVIKLPNSGASELQYRIDGIGDGNYYSLEWVKQRVLQYQQQHGVTLALAAPVVAPVSAVVENGWVVNVPKQEQIRRFLTQNPTAFLDSLGLPGWIVTKLPQGSARQNNRYELTIPWHDSIIIDGKGNLEKIIQEKAREMKDINPAPSKKVIEERLAIEDATVINLPWEPQTTLVSPDEVIPVGQSGEQREFNGITYRWHKNLQGWVSAKDMIIDPISGEKTPRVLKPTAGDNVIILGDKSKAEEIIPLERRLEYKKSIDATEQGMSWAIEEVLKDPQNRIPRLIEHLRNNWGKYVAAGIVSAILMYLYLNRNQQVKPDDSSSSGAQPPIPAPTPADSASLASATAYCSQFINAPKSTIAFDRLNMTGGVKLTEHRRTDISRRFSESKAWSDLLKEVKTNKYKPDCQDLVGRIQETTKPEGRTIEKIQDIQRLIGMKDVDNKDAQDGILGPITTKAIREFLEKNKETSESKPVAPKQEGGVEV